MKKRVFSLLLSLCLVAGLFAGMLSTTAYADGSTQSYTVQKGDTLAKICEKCGVDYASNIEWIKNTNNIKNVNIISVGQVLTLPAAGTVLHWVAPAGTTASTGTATAATGTTSSASTIQYTLKNGDYVLKVCQDLGIDFAKNEAWIKAANNITNFNNLKVGRVLTLPAPGTTPALSTAGSTSAGATATNLAATTTTTAAGDTVSYYLIEYTVRSGDTLFNICNSFGANMDTVQKLNNIANAAALRVGQVISIPTKSVPASGNYVKIISHKVVSGDTVQGLCSKYGIDYGKNVAKIKALNNRDNLDAIKVGQTLLLPVSGSVAVGGTTGTSATPVATGTVGNTAATTYYTLNKNGTVNGTYALTVGGQAVNGAAAGSTVHVVTTPDHGFKLSSVNVVRAYNGEKVAVDANNNFVMPACNVSISVSFMVDETAQPHQIIKSSVSSGVGQTYVVNGFTNSVAEKGQTVQIVLNTLPSGQTVDKVYVTTVQPSLDQLKNNKLDASQIIAVSGDLRFTMPGSTVYVTVLLKAS